MPAVVGGALALAGGVASGVGGFFGAGSQNRAGRKARDYYHDQTLMGMASMARSLYGGDSLDYLAHRLDPYSFERLFGHGEREYTQRVPYGEGDAPDGFDITRLGKTRQATDPASAGWFNPAEFANAGPGLLGSMETIANDAIAEQEANVATLSDRFNLLEGRGDELMTQLGTGYGQARRQVLGKLGDQERTFREFGKQREGVIRSDAAEALANMNQASDARLGALGVNTLASNQRAGNAAEINRETNRALTDVADRRAQLVGGSQGFQAQALSRLFGDELDATRQLGSRNLDRAQAQALALAGLRDQNVARGAQLRAQPLNMELSLLGSPLFNPWLGRQTSQFYPGFSGIGTAFNEIGKGAGTYGGYLLGQGFGGNGGEDEIPNQ